jgi:AraC-like DNA-binding protein
MDAKIKSTLKELITITTDFAQTDGMLDTPISSLKIIQTSKKTEPIHSVYGPSLCVVLQGSKDVILADEIYSYRPSQFLVTSHDLPVSGQVTEASPSRPYLCLMLEIDPAIIFEILKDSTSDFSQETSVRRGIFVGDIDQAFIDSFLRLLQTMKRPREIPVLAPLIIREILYRLLSSPHSDMVKQHGLIGSQSQRIAKVISLIKKDFAKPLKNDLLAKEASMSLSSLHQHFKQITAMSPLQFQKQIRLQEARRILMSEAIDAASVGYQVGYESPSQFSREYARLFGLPPMSDMKRMKP